MQHTSINASLPNNESFHSTHEILFNHNLPPLSNKWWIIPHSQSSLLPVGKLCDSNFTTIFKNDKAYIEQNDNNNIKLIKKVFTDSKQTTQAHRDPNNNSHVVSNDASNIHNYHKAKSYDFLPDFNINIDDHHSAKNNDVPPTLNINLAHNVSNYPHMPCNLHQIKSKYERIRHLHSDCGSPVKSSFLSAIKRQFQKLAWTKMQRRIKIFE